MSPNPTKHNADELEPPMWLNKEFFTKVLKRIEKSEKVHINNLNLSPATVKGDHYASIMFRAVIDFHVNDEAKSKSLVLKTMPEMEGRKKDILNESFIFETEIGIYTEVIPEFKEILKSVGDEEVTLGAVCVYHSLSPKKIIIFEDLLPMGYVVQPEQNLSFDELKIAFEKLAKMHAVSHKILLEQPSYFDAYRYGLINMKSFYETDSIKNGTKFFIEMLGEHEDLLPYKPYFIALNKKNLLLSSVNSFNEYRNDPQNSTFYVLCHGDFHFKNIMLKRDPKTDQLLDLMLLDFQLCYIGPAVNDLIYSFYMLLNGEQRIEVFDELLYCYFTKLISTLQKIGFKEKMPKLTCFRQQFMKYKNIELFLLTTFLPVWLVFRNGDFDAEEMATSAEKQRKLYKNPAYLAQVRGILPKYLYLGYLEQ